MTISTPSLPADPLASGAPTGADADLLAALGLAGTPAGQTPADAGTAGTAGFAALLPDAAAPEPAAADPVNSEQAAAFAAALLWTPAPLLVETAPNAGLTGAPAEPLASDGEVASDLAAPAEPREKSVAPAMARVASSTVEFAPQETNAAAQSTAPDGAARHPARPPVAQPAAPVQVQAAPPTAEVSLAANVAVTPATATEPGSAPITAEVGLALNPAVTTASATEPGSAPAAAEHESVVADTAERPLRDPDFLHVGRPWRAPAAKEKFAALSGRAAQDFASPMTVGPKTFLSATQQAGRGAVEIVGTGVAESEDTMPSAPVIQPSAAENPAALPALPAPTVGQSQGSPVPQVEFSGLITSEPAVQARDAVAAVMQVVDAQEKPAPGASQTVNLDFNFGPDRLSVRVERLADGTVQAHFRTDSPGLRAALAHEWQQAAAAPENILRFAEPVYQSSARADQPASFGAGAEGRASQDQARAQQQAAAGFSGRPARAGTRPPSVTTHPEAPRVRSSSSARHLQAVA